MQASSSSTAPGSFDRRTSKDDLIRRGVPAEYAGAFSDEQFMKGLLDSTDEVSRQRRKQLRRYLLMHKIILGVLIVQAILGVCIAVWKTLLQPDFVFKGEVLMENIDVIMMLDSSTSMRDLREGQSSTATEFTKMLKKASEQRMTEARATALEQVRKRHKEHGWNFRDFLPFLSDAEPTEEDVGHHGGHMRIATGLFNHYHSRLLHGFTREAEAQEEALKNLRAKDFRGVAEWKAALTQCKEAVKNDWRPQTRRFCVIFGNSQLMCSKRKEETMDKICETYPDMCPPQKDVERYGNMMEYDHEFRECTGPEVLGTEEERKALGLDFVIMFMAATQEEEQIHLAIESFRDLVNKLTTCTFLPEDAKVYDEVGFLNNVVRWTPDETCPQFVVSRSHHDLGAKSVRISQLLQDYANTDVDPNLVKDNRFLFFLLLPLGLLFYLCWSRLLHLYATFLTGVPRDKSRMLKVTKTLVEKQPTVAKTLSNVKEVELAVAMLAPEVQLGTVVTLRARLMGGLLRADTELSTVDGRGGRCDPNAQWLIEFAGEADGKDPLLVGGQLMRLRSHKGEALRVSSGAEGTVSLMAAELVPKVVHGASSGSDMTFLMEHVEDGDTFCHLGSCVRILCRSTGGYLRVLKNGCCDGVGRLGEPETLFAIDLGGPCLHPGVVTNITAEGSGEPLCANAEGAVSAAPDCEDWRCWKILRVQAAGPSSYVHEFGQFMEPPLRSGDVVELVAPNQRLLRVTGDGHVHCNAAMGGRHEFVIERLGMRHARHRDDTIRGGMTVSLRPVGEDSDYLETSIDGVLGAAGSSVSKDIGFTLELATLAEVAGPITAIAVQGDVKLCIGNDSRKEDKFVDALMATWTQQEDLNAMHGDFVMADDDGQFHIPKSVIEGGRGWVAVAHDSVDISGIAAKAIAQGARGLILKSDQALSLQHLAKDTHEPPNLPVVYVDSDSVGSKLDDPGHGLLSSEVKFKKLTPALRAIGEAAQGGGHWNTENAGETFDTVGSALMEQYELRSEKQKEKERMENKPPTATNGQEPTYKWKVQANTHYLWATGTGGATTMKVNWGDKVPPSALCAQSLKPLPSSRASMRRPVERRSTLGTTIVDVDEVKAHRLGAELTQVLSEEQAHEPLEQLGEESDFKIEYEFEEVNLNAAEAAKLADDEIVVDERGKYLGRLAAPAKYFWVVMAGLASMTVLLLGVVAYLVISRAGKDPATAELVHELDDNPEPRPWPGIQS